MALKLIGQALLELKPTNIIWILDKPVSNSGRLKTRIHEVGTTLGVSWDVILDNNPDRYIVNKNELAISADGWIIEQVKWFNLAAYIIEGKIEGAEIFDFKTIANDK